ncbi:MAG TPA: magnesium and cobalt transport protein CorA [Thermomicrobiales bacterium]|nr:magnesium and cobalt transport protein CorA [Thermomicrobiales bacterium]
MIVDCAAYIDGKRSQVPGTIEATSRAIRAFGGLAWIELRDPDPDEFAQVAREFDLHELAVEDAVVAHQRPKVERYDDTLFVVLRAASYHDRSESVEFTELHVFAGPGFVITVQRGAGSEVNRVRRRMESDPDLLQLGTEAILYAIMDRVVDDFRPVVQGLQTDIDQIEDQMFLASMDVTQRTYELAREVIEFQRATKPLVGMLGGLINGGPKYGTPPELLDYLRDVQDHAIQVQEQVAGFRELIQNILNVNLAIVGMQQNEEVKAMTRASLAQNDEVKKISSWAAILFAPTLVGTVYGMNFNMPETHWAFGYPFAMILMLLVSVLMYLWFRYKGWLS